MRIFDVPIAALTYDEAEQRIRGMITSGRPHQLVLANAHTLNLAFRDPTYRKVLQDASLVLRDGVGVELAARYAGRPLRENFVGTDFVPKLLVSLADLGPRVFLYGAAPGIAAGAAQTLEARCPQLRIVGVEHGYGEDVEVLAGIRAARPDVLLVALGNPQQEDWIARHLDALPVGVAIGVGALFDFLSGNVTRAPLWMRRWRCEWLFRLGVEPRRLFRRYVVGNPKFLWRVATTLDRRPS